MNLDLDRLQQQIADERQERADKEVLDSYIARQMADEMRRILTKLECDPDVPLPEKQHLVRFLQHYMRLHHPQAFK